MPFFKNLYSVIIDAYLIPNMKAHFVFYWPSSEYPVILNYITKHPVGLLWTSPLEPGWGLGARVSSAGIQRTQMAWRQRDVLWLEGGEGGTVHISLEMQLNRKQWPRRRERKNKISLHDYKWLDLETSEKFRPDLIGAKTLNSRGPIYEGCSEAVLPTATAGLDSLGKSFPKNIRAPCNMPSLHHFHHSYTHFQYVQIIFFPNQSFTLSPH